MGVGDDITELVRRRIADLHTNRRFDLARVAEALEVDPSAVSKNVRIPGRALSLRFVATVAELAHQPLAELVVPDGSLIKQLDADEAALLRYLRQWPKSVIRSLVGFLQFFADEPPAETMTRNLHEVWRRFDRQKRERLFSIALLLSEGMLTPDLLTALQERLAADQLAGGDARGSDERRRRP